MIKLNTIKFAKLYGVFAILILCGFLGACNGGGTSPSGQAISSSAKEITLYSLNGESGVITGQDIVVIMSLGTNVDSLAATFTTTGASVTVNGTLQISGVTTNNFTSPVTYLVTAADGSTESYVVRAAVSDDYIFHMSVNHASNADATCGQEFFDRLQYDITADPQAVTLMGYYDILRLEGSYNVVNYQNLGTFILNPLGVARTYEFAGWRDGDFITINNHNYSLYGISFNIPDICHSQSQWGACGVLNLMINDGPESVCVVHSP